MSYHYLFYVEDVTCEKCEARIREALEGLPDSQQVDLTRTPQDEARVVFMARQEVPHTTIEQLIAQKSAGTTHQYRVRW